MTASGASASFAQGLTDGSSCPIAAIPYSDSARPVAGKRAC